MAFQLKQEESLHKGIQRIARKQMDAALEHLGRPHDRPRDEAIHGARKSFKKIRAVLRLVRPCLGEAAFQVENACFRDAGRPLTEVRDAEILVEALDKLTEHFAEAIRGQSFDGIRKGLLAHQREVHKLVLEEQSALAKVANAVQAARDRSDGWTDVPDHWSSIGDGLQQVYRQARRAFAAAVLDPTVESLHEWRKQAKYLRYQLDILRPLWKEILQALADQADRLTELLGDDHDLAVLRQQLSEDPHRFGDGAIQELVLALIARRRAELQHEARPLGRRLFQDPPREFARRLKGYWQTWRADREEQADEPLAPGFTMRQSDVDSSGF